MVMSRQDVYREVRSILVDILDVKEEEVTRESRLVRDLNTERYEFLEIAFRVAQGFDIKIPDGCLFPNSRVITTPDSYEPGFDPVNNYLGRVTPEAADAILEQLYGDDFSLFSEYRELEILSSDLTAGHIVDYVSSRLESGGLHE